MLTVYERIIEGVLIFAAVATICFSINIFSKLNDGRINTVVNQLTNNTATAGK